MAKNTIKLANKVKFQVSSWHRLNAKAVQTENWERWEGHITVTASRQRVQEQGEKELDLDPKE